MFYQNHSILISTVVDNIAGYRGHLQGYRFGYRGKGEGIKNHGPLQKQKAFKNVILKAFEK